MRLNRTGHAIAAATIMATAAVGCGSEPAAETATTESSLLGDALPGTDATHFSDANAAFVLSENATDGLGPIFNERA